MQRIAIIGSPGSGKSTLAHQLGHILAVKVTHLDAVFWQPSWDDVPEAIWRKELAELIRQECWILDGNHPDAIDSYLMAADTIIFLDVHHFVCVLRVIWRFLKYRGGSRPDLPEYIEVFDWDTVKGVWFYSRVERPLVLQKLNQFAQGRQIHRFQSSTEINQFLQQAQRNQKSS